MSGKRPPQYQIDEKDLYEKQCQQNQQTPEDKINSNSKPIEQRKIYSIIKNDNVKQTKIDFKIKISDEPQILKNINQKKQKIDNTENKEKNNNNQIFKTNLLFQQNGKGLFPTSLNTGLFSNIQNANNYSKFNLFGNTENGNSTSIFNFAKNVPPVKLGQQTLFDDHQGNSEQSAELQRLQQLSSDPSKSKKNYKYNEKCQTLYKGNVMKFKKDHGDLVENVQLSLLKDEELKIHHLVIKLPSTKNTIFNAIVFKEKSTIRNINQNPKNMEITIFQLQKEQIYPHKIKLQMQNQQQCSKCKLILENIIKGNNQSESKSKSQ